MSAFDDVVVQQRCGMSSYQRIKLKSELVKKNLNFLSSTGSQKSLRREMKSQRRADLDGNPMIFLSNLKQVLNSRIQRLHNAGKLVFHDYFKKRIVLGIVGDKGDSYTKLCVAVGNVEQAGSSRGLIRPVHKNFLCAPIGLKT